MHRLLVVSFRASPQTGVGIRTPVLASLCEGGVMAFGHDGGRDITRTHPRCSFRRGRCPRSGAKRNKYPWGTSPRRARRRGIPSPPSVREVARSAGGRDMPRQRRSIKLKGTFRAPARGTFALGGKSTQKRRQKLRFWISLRAFACCLSRLFSHANAVPCKLPLNVALSLLLGALPLLL